MTHTPAQSSNIASIGYDNASQRLQVAMKHGKVYEYSGVEEGTHRELLNAESVGQFVHARIKGRYPMREVE